MSMKRLLNYLFLSALLLSCAKEEFGKTTRTTTQAIQAREDLTFANDCSNNFTEIRPEVDFLFIFDNSSSTRFINAETQAAMRNTLSLVSSRYDYHVMVAPLIRTNSDINQGASLAVRSVDGLNQDALNLVVAADSSQLIGNAANIGTVNTGSAELAFSRTVELLNHNRTNGIFRDNAYTVIVTLADEDADFIQTGPGNQGSVAEQQDFNDNYNALVALSNSMNSLQFRYLTVVPGPDMTNCDISFRSGRRYRTMSNSIYVHNFSKPGFVDPNPQTTPDSFNLCSNSFSGLFSSIDQTIENIIQAHTYNNWLIGTTYDPSFDPSTLRVFKVFGNSNSQAELFVSTTNGYEYLGFQQALNTRILPSPGEPESGFMIRLNGTAQVTFPECIVINALAPADHFGYIVTAEEPDRSTVVFKKNGVTFSQSTTNGWEYVGFVQNFNIKITSPGSFTPGTPEVNRTGYLFKLNGNAQYTNGDQVQIDFFPVSK